MLRGKGYGMPSSHSQFSAFFFLYLALLLLHRGLGGPLLPTWRRYSYTLAAAVGSVAVAASRIYLHYHTPRQVVVGYLAGLLCAAGWYAVTEVLDSIVVVAASGTTAREWLLSAGECLWLRDRCLKEDLVVKGWQTKRKQG